MLGSVGPRDKKRLQEVVVVPEKQVCILGDLNERKEDGRRKVLKATRQNDQVSYKDSPILRTYDYKLEAFKGIWVLKDVLKSNKRPKLLA